MAKKKDLVEEVITDIDKSQTFNPLINILKLNDKKNLFTTNVSTAFHKTGFPIFDYYFGSVINIHDKLGEIIRQESRVGQAAGSINMIVGRSTSGKSTLSIQIAANIIRQYKTSQVIHFDCEQRMNISRIESITNLSSDYFLNNRYIIRSGAVGLDVIQEAIVKLYTSKMSLKDELMINNEFTDEFGNEIKILEPSIIIIDSITTVLNETFSIENTKEASEAAKLRSNTEGARDSKTFRGFLKDILPLCKEANIIIYLINHINTNMSMNSFVPVTRQQNFLKQDESIPGGTALLYYTFNIIKLTAKPSDDFTEETDGFSGHIVMIEPIKSSSNQSGNNSKGLSFEMVFSFKYGFDSLRTLVLYAKNNGIIEGNKTRMKFKDNDSYTFSFKNIYQEKDENPIWDDLKKYVIPKLNDHLPFLELTHIKFDKELLNY